MSLKTKLIAMYLPQYHSIPENDEWWGEGFTEWTTVKQSTPLWRYHNQPRVPKDNNYYNLLDKKTMIWQAGIAAKAGIYGFCFYHYYFERGRKVLEKPAENLLKWTDIKLPFCFSWANEPWIRTWSTLKDGNAWNPKFDAKIRTKERDVLINQDYGLEEDWKAHFNYLLPFFNDSRYIKLEGKPVFLITRPEIIPCVNQMIGYWRELAKKCGFPGIYIIGSNTKFEGFARSMNARYIYEPVYSRLADPPKSWLYRDIIIKKLEKYGIQVPHVYQYDKLWKHILDRIVPTDKKTYLGALANYDDSPRRGKRAGILIGFTPEKLYKYLKALIMKNEALGNEYIFITAWNEWGEGAYLEPDNKYGYGSLRAISKAVRDCSKSKE